jgi:sugar phosphate permease
MRSLKNGSKTCRVAGDWFGNGRKYYSVMKNLIFAALVSAIVASIALIYFKDRGTATHASEPATQVIEVVQQFQPEEQQPPQEAVSIVLTNVDTPTAVVVTNKVVRPRKVTIVVDPQFGGVKK